MLGLMMTVRKSPMLDLTDPTRLLGRIQAPQQQVSASPAKCPASYILDTVIP